MTPVGLRNIFVGKCFIYCSNEVKWETAGNICLALNGTLAVDNTSNTHKALNLLLNRTGTGKSEAWIAARTQPRQWNWLYNTKGIVYFQSISLSLYIKSVSFKAILYKAMLGIMWNTTSSLVDESRSHFYNYLQRSCQIQ